MDQNINRNDFKQQAGRGVSETSVLQPVNLLEVLDGAEFPTSKMELISYAEDQGASEDVLDLLQGIPDDIYNSLSDVNRHASDIDVIEGEENLFSSEPPRDLPDEAESFVSEMNISGRI